MSVVWTENAIESIEKIRTYRDPPRFTEETQIDLAECIIDNAEALVEEAVRHQLLPDGTREKRVHKIVPGHRRPIDLAYKIVYEVPDPENAPDQLNILSVWHTSQERFGQGRR